MRLLAILSIALMLSGCAFFQNIMQPSPNLVASAEASLAAADSSAMNYVMLPKCGSNAASGSKVCSDSAIVKNIDKARAVAYTTVKTAEANENSTTLAAMQNAVTAYQTIVTTLQ